MYIIQLHKQLHHNIMINSVMHVYTLHWSLHFLCYNFIYLLSAKNEIGDQVIL